MNWQPILDHVNRATARLLEQYKTKPRIAALLEGFIVEIQQLDDVLNVLGTQRGIDVAVGAQLDGIGAIVGLPRPPGLPDADYLFLIKTKIVQNLNEGTAEEFIAAAKFFTGQDTVFYTEVYPAAVDLLVYTPIDPVVAAGIKIRLEKFLPATVKLEVFGYIPPTPFLFDEGFGFGNDAETTGDLLADIY